MGKSPIEDYLTCVQKSKLATREQIVKVLDRIKRETGGKPVKLPFVAQCFVDARLVSPWQNEKLLKGRYHGFFLGNYKLLQHLASGGMSNIYLAEHVQMHRRVAIKVLPPSLTNNTSYLQRFYIESRAIASLDHKNIVRAYDVACEGKYHYLVLEYVDGIDLRDLVTKEGPLTYERAADYVRQAAEGLQHAHSKGLIHRDIKPANLLLDKEGVIKLLDMGLSRITHEEHSLTRAHNENIIGTVDYLAPEQAVDSHTVDHRADIYGLGGTLYFLLTGHPPFPEGSHTERLMKHQSEEAEPITVTRPDAPPDLIALCNRMMAKQANDRHQTAAEVAQDLSRWLASYQSRSQGSSSFDDTRDVAGLYGDTGPDIHRESDSFDSESMTIDIPKMMMSAQAQGEQARQIAQAMTKAIADTPGGPVPPADPLAVPSDSAARRREADFARREVELNRRLADLERRETAARERDALAQARPRGRLTDDEEIERRAALELRASELEHTEEKLQKLDRYLESKAGELEQRAIDVEKARSKLNRLEQFLEKKAAELEKRQREVDVSRSKLTGLEQFLEKKAGELEKRTTLVDKAQEKSGADKAALEKREADLALKEQKLAERERTVTEREKKAAAAPSVKHLSPSGIGLPTLAFPDLDPSESAVRGGRSTGGSGVSAMQAAAIEQRTKELDARAKEVEARGKDLEAREKALAERTKAAASQQSAAAQLERAAEAKQAELETQYAAVEAARAELAEQERAFDARKSEAAARERDLIRQESELEGKQTEIDGRLAEIERQQALTAEMNKRLETQRAEHEQRIEEFERRRQEVAQKSGELEGRLQDLERREADWANRWAELEARSANVGVVDEETKKADAARNALAQDIKVQAELLQRSTKDLERRWLRLEKKEAELAAARAEFESLQRGSASEASKGKLAAIPPAAAQPAPTPAAQPAIAQSAPRTPALPPTPARPAPAPAPAPPAPAALPPQPAPVMPAAMGGNGLGLGDPASTPAPASNPNRTIRIAPRHMPALSPLPQPGPAMRPIGPPPSATPQPLMAESNEALPALSPLGISGDDVANAFFAAADDASGFLPTTNSPTNEHSTANLGGGRHRSGNEHDRKVRASAEARMGQGHRVNMEEIVRIEQPALGAPSRSIRDDEATEHFTKEMLGLMGPPEAAAMAASAPGVKNENQAMAEGSGSFTLDWPFPETRDAEVVTTRRIAYEGQPILFVQREPETNRWRFLDGMRTGPDDLTVLPLGDVVGLDPSVREVAKMGIGWQAWRATDRDPWQKAPRA